MSNSTFTSRLYIWMGWLNKHETWRHEVNKWQGIPHDDVPISISREQSPWEMKRQGWRHCVSVTYQLYRTPKLKAVHYTWILADNFVPVRDFGNLLYTYVASARNANSSAKPHPPSQSVQDAQEFQSLLPSLPVAHSQLMGAPLCITPGEPTREPAREGERGKEREREGDSFPGSSPSSDKSSGMVYGLVNSLP